MHCAPFLCAMLLVLLAAVVVVLFWCWRRCWGLGCICCCLRSCVLCCWLLIQHGDKTLRLRAGRGARHSCSRPKTTGIFGSAWCVALGHPCPRQKATGTFGSVWRAALGIPVHGKGLRESSASLGAGRGDFLSTVNDNENRRPRVRRHAGDFFVHGEGLRESSTSCGAGRWGFVSMVKDYGNIRPRMGRGAVDSCPRSRITGILDLVWGGQ